eukprot:g4371.t2
MVHPAPVSGSPVLVRKACPLPSHQPERAGSGDENADAPADSRFTDAASTPPSSHSPPAKREAQGSQKPEGPSISDLEETREEGGTVGNGAAGVADHNAEDEKDRRASSKDPHPTTTELSTTSAARGRESDATKGIAADVGVHGAAYHPADGLSLPACAAGAGGGIEVDVEAPLQEAEAALARLYDTHDNFFSSDKAEREEEKGVDLGGRSVRPHIKVAVDTLQTATAGSMQQAPGYCPTSAIHELLCHPTLQRRLKGQAQEVLEALASIDDGNARGMRERARVSYIRGRALDVFGDFDPEAEKCLAKAVKLRPGEADGWSGLGHCYWKKPDLFAARRCFLTSLDKSRSADNMRQLSMLLRQLPGTAEETQDDHLQESLRLAKEALKMDIGCGDSWYVLGNAYVASFFRSSRGIRDLDRALQAYKKAESNGGGGNPDLFFNRAHVYHYREDYAEAIRDYRFARQLDPQLPVGPALQSIETGVERLARLVDRKGGLKAKRLSQLIAPLWGDSARRGLSESCRLVGLKELRLGKNKGVAVALKVIMPAGQTGQPPERFVVVDRGGEAAVLSLYSISKEACDKIQSKDTLVVKEPTLRTIFVGVPPPSTPPPPPPPLGTEPPGEGQPTSSPDTPPRSNSSPRAVKSDAVRTSDLVADKIGPVGALPADHGTSEASLDSCPANSGGREATVAGPTVLEAGNTGEATSSGSTAAVRGAAVASSAGLPDGPGNVGDLTASSSPSAVVGAGGSPAATVPGAGTVALPTISYPGIQADPADVLLNGDTMRASFAPPAVRLATFDK